VRPVLLALLTLLAFPAGQAAASTPQEDAARDDLLKFSDILQTGDWSARMQAVHELEYMQTGGLRGLALAAQDGDWQIRMTAISALGNSTGDSAKLLRKLMKKEECPVVALVILHTLGGAARDDEEAHVMDTISGQNAEQVNGCLNQPEPGPAAWADIESPARTAATTPAPAAPAAAETAVRSGVKGGALGRRNLAAQTMPKPKMMDPGDHSYSAAGKYEDAGGKFAHDSIPDLIASLKSGDPETRALAADALGHFGADAGAAVNPLIAALGDKNPRVRSSAGLALGNIGADAADVVPRLISALDDRNVDVRYAAALALSRIGTPEARRAIERFPRL
jgi:hypothetical protein